MNIGICGAGTMGRGIALNAIVAGHSVVLIDQVPEALAFATTYIAEQLAASVAKRRITAEASAQALLLFATDSGLSALSESDLVIEAIVERLDDKQALLKNVESVCRPSCIIASNTSSIAVTALATCLSRPENFVGLHFFNPAHIMKLVEVVKGTGTSDATLSFAFDFAKGLGKTPVIAKDVPGFIVNRVARNFYNESQRIVMEQAATVLQVDTAMKAIGFKMGPFELMDLIGVDVNLDVTTSMWNQYFMEPRFTPSLLQQQTVDGGMHGRKSGRGFYTYDDTPSAD